MATSNHIPTIVTIQLSKGYSTIVDVEDADLAMHKWHKLNNGYSNVYAESSSPHFGKQHTLLHRIILARILGRELVKGEYVDHIDGDGLNNTRANLRLATNTENAQNQKRRSNNTSGFKGVWQHKPTGKWTSKIRFSGGRKYLGYFDTPEEAYAAYCKAAEELHKAFARFE